MGIELVNGNGKGQKCQRKRREKMGFKRGIEDDEEEEEWEMGKGGKFKRV